MIFGKIIYQYEAKSERKQVFVSGWLGEPDTYNTICQDFLSQQTLHNCEAEFLQSTFIEYNEMRGFQVYLKSIFLLSTESSEAVEKSILCSCVISSVCLELDKFSKEKEIQKIHSGQMAQMSFIRLNFQTWNETLFS